MLLFEEGDWLPLPPAIAGERLRQYLQEIWERRRLDLPGTAPSTQDILRFDGNRVQAGRLVGYVSFENHDFHLVPKLFAGASHSVSSIHAHLHWWRSYAGSWRAPFTWNAALADSAGNPLLVYVHYFLQVATQVLDQPPGLVFEEERETGPRVRGRLDLPEYLRASLPSGNWHQLPGIHSAPRPDTLLYRILAATFRHLLPHAGFLRPDLEKLLLRLLGNDTEPVTATDCDNPVLRGLPAPVQKVLAMCRFFLENREDGRLPYGEGAFSLLVPASRLFERFVAGFLQTHLPELKVEVQAGQSLGEQTDESTGWLRPDLWLPNSGVVADTKYKLTGNGRPEPSDVYQVFTYAHRFGARRALLLYPTLAEAAPLPAVSFTIGSQLGGENVTVESQQLQICLAKDEAATPEAFVGKRVPALLAQLRQIFSQRD